MKSCIYCRVSVDDVKNPRDSIKTQEKVCREKAEERNDEVVEVYQDINKSGGSLNRPQLKRLIEDARQSKFSAIYIMNFSRLSRKIKDQETLIEEMEKLGIKFVSADGTEDKTIRQITGVMNEYQRDFFRKQTEIEHQTRLKEKIALNRPPTGYKIDNKEKYFIIDKKKVELIKRIFELRIQGREIKEIAIETKMSFPTIKNILQNRTYIGFNKYRNEWIEGKHQPIISKEVFEKCQRI